MKPKSPCLLTLLAVCALAHNAPAKSPETAPPAKPQVHAADTHVPDWATDVVWYQIFPERFRNGDPTNDPTRDSLEFPVKPSEKWRVSSWTADWYSRDEWEKDFGADFYEQGAFHRRYGGDLKGVLDKLDYLADLGVTAIYFNPLFYSRSLHKYDGNSFHHIDPYFGPDPKGDFALMEKETSDPATWQWTAADKLFLELLGKAHERGMKVIIDGVFNHTGRDFFAFRDLRRNQEKSPYKDWYFVEQFDDATTQRNEFKYKGWWGHATLPVFTASADGKDVHPGPKEYIFNATRRWMDPNGDGDPSDGINGWRLDVADERPATFWADWNAHERKLNPAAYTTAEIWSDAAKLISEGAFSASMNYNAFAIPVKGFLVDRNVPPSKFVKLLEERRAVYPKPVAYAMQNLLDSHDTDRIASQVVNGEGTQYRDPQQIEYNTSNSARSSKTYKITKPTERHRKIQRLVALFQMTYVGAPMIYYGTEAGMWSGHDPDDRMPMVWADMKFDPQATDPRGGTREPDDVNFDPAIFKFYKDVIQLRRDHAVLRRGDFVVLGAFDEEQTVAFLREGGDEALMVVINRSDKEQSVKVKLPGDQAEKWKQAKAMFVTTGEMGDISLVQSGGAIEVKLPALTGVVIGRP